MELRWIGLSEGYLAVHCFNNMINVMDSFWMTCHFICASYQEGDVYQFKPNICQDLSSLFKATTSLAAMWPSYVTWHHVS